MSEQKQCMEALERANFVRLRRADVKEDIKRKRVPIHDVLADAPHFKWLEKMQVGELLMAQERWGKFRMNRFLNECEISPTKQIGTLTERQRRDMVRRLDKRHTSA